MDAGYPVLSSDLEACRMFDQYSYKVSPRALHQRVASLSSRFRPTASIDFDIEYSNISKAWAVLAIGDRVIDSPFSPAKLKLVSTETETETETESRLLAVDADRTFHLQGGRLGSALIYSSESGSCPISQRENPRHDAIITRQPCDSCRTARRIACLSNVRANSVTGLNRLPSLEQVFVPSRATFASTEFINRCADCSFFVLYYALLR